MKKIVLYGIGLFTTAMLFTSCNKQDNLTLTRATTATPLTRNSVNNALQHAAAKPNVVILYTTGVYLSKADSPTGYEGCNNIVKADCIDNVYVFDHVHTPRFPVVDSIHGGEITRTGSVISNPGTDPQQLTIYKPAGPEVHYITYFEVVSIADGITSFKYN